MHERQQVSDIFFPLMVQILLKSSITYLIFCLGCSRPRGGRGGSPAMLNRGAG